MFDKYENENELKLNIVFKLIRYIGSGVSNLSVCMPQDIDPFDAPTWIAINFPNWEIDGISLVSPKEWESLRE